MAGDGGSNTETTEGVVRPGSSYADIIKMQEENAAARGAKQAKAKRKGWHDQGEAVVPKVEVKKSKYAVVSPPHNLPAGVQMTGRDRQFGGDPAKIVERNEESQ